MKKEELKRCLLEIFISIFIVAFIIFVFCYLVSEVYLTTPIGNQIEVTSSITEVAYSSVRVVMVWNDITTITLSNGDNISFVHSNINGFLLNTSLTIYIHKTRSGYYILDEVSVKPCANL